MKVAVKCHITLFYPLSHLVGEHKPKPEPVLHHFNFKYHIQQPVMLTQRWAAWFFLYFLTFCQSLMDTCIPSYLRSAGRRSLLGVFWLSRMQMSVTSAKCLVSMCSTATAPFPAEDTGLSVLIQEVVAFIRGHGIITGISAGRCGCKWPAFTWNSHSRWPEKQFQKTPVSQSLGSSRNQMSPGWFMVEDCSWVWFRAARLYFVLT